MDQGKWELARGGNGGQKLTKHMAMMWLKHRIPSVGSRPGIRWLALVFSWVWCISSVAAAEVKFTALLDRDSIVLGETVALSLQFEGGAPKGLPGLPPIPGLQVAPGISTSMNTSLGPDGRMTTVQGYTITLVPQQVGEFVIPSLVANVDGQRLRSQPLKLKVLQSDPSAPPAESSDKLAFLWLVLAKPEVYVGEQFVAE